MTYLHFKKGGTYDEGKTEEVARKLQCDSMSVFCVLSGTLYIKLFVSSLSAPAFDLSALG